MNSDSHRDPAPEVAASFSSMATEQNPDYAVARRLIAQARDHHAKYEGVTAPSKKPAGKPIWPRNALGAPFRFMRNIAEYNDCGAADDNHCPGLVRPLLFKALFNPVGARQVDRKLRPGYVTPELLANRRYAVFPLHTEPEISLLLYGRPFLNQIEIVRALALSLPADMILIIKEHLWMVGKRSMGSYRKFVNIHRVHFAAPEMDLRDLITKATLVTLLTGSSGIEAGFAPEERRRDDNLARLASFAIKRAGESAADAPANVEIGSW